MKILVVEDDPNLSGFLRTHLREQGFAVDVADTGAGAIAAYRVNEYDILLLDFHLPDMTGDSVLAHLREIRTAPPVLMLTVIADAHSKIRILNAGADDYVVKPFVFGELVARIYALLRRAPQSAPEIITVGNVTIDVLRKQTRHAGELIPLTRTEFSLLEYLARYQGSVVSKASLIEHVWESSTDAFSSAVDTHLGNLRRKLGAPELIRTVRGRGYVIE